MTLRVLIVDDEPLARERIRACLEGVAGVEIAGECGDGEDAVADIERLRPDLVFLDVQMPELDGFAVLEALKVEPLPAVVFVTAYDEFAVRAFEVRAVDYLMKPFACARVHDAVERVRARAAGTADEVAERLRALLRDLEPRRGWLERIPVRVGPRVLFVRAADIDWIEGEGNYARLKVGGKAYLLRETLARLEERLSPEHFVRIHRSVIVNVERIREIQPMFKGTYQVMLHDGTRLTSTRTYRDRIRRLIEAS
jgi:two-component system, LytTR family, response regulator